MKQYTYSQTNAFIKIGGMFYTKESLNYELNKTIRSIIDMDVHKHINTPLGAKITVDFDMHERRVERAMHVFNYVQKLSSVKGLVSHTNIMLAAQLYPIFSDTLEMQKIIGNPN